MRTDIADVKFGGRRVQFGAGALILLSGESALKPYVPHAHKHVHAGLPSSH